MTRNTVVWYWCDNCNGGRGMYTKSHGTATHQAGYRVPPGQVNTMQHAMQDDIQDAPGAWNVQVNFVQNHGEGPPIDGSEDALLGEDEAFMIEDQDSVETPMDGVEIEEVVDQPYEGQQLIIR